ncbi:sensor histidine kinase [Burkholderia perseverans]|uniref:sensor histidine kinase n=1 Tax=Burkholderia perseverans TaxID=2615214 RepID=UPI001FEF8AA5|nr:HAMP domain-containing sensor histidine kinase [Burkholderia perseverans]
MRAVWKNSLAARLWLINVAVLALSLGGLAEMVVRAYDANPEHIITRNERLDTAYDVANGLRFDEAGMPRAVSLTRQHGWLFGVAPGEFRYRVLDSRGGVLLSSMPAQPPGAWPLPASGLADASTGHSTVAGRPFAVATVKVMHGGVPYFVQTAASLQFIDALASLRIQPVPRIVEIIVLISAPVFGLTLPLTIRHVLRPLRDVSRAAAGITPKHLEARLPLRNVPGEIRPLIGAFNAALARLEDGFESQQQFLACAAHELQTPLTLLRGHIELQADIGGRADLLGEIDLIARHVRQLLHLAEAGEAHNFQFEEIDALDVMKDAVDYLAQRADEKAVRLHIVECESQPTVVADRGALFILLKNIVENAIDASPKRGIVLLRLDADGLHVCDSGAGVPAADIPNLFRPFWRAPNSAGHGSGLGLAICGEIAAAHGWEIAVRCSLVGTRFSVGVYG